MDEKPLLIGANRARSSGDDSNYFPDGERFLESEDRAEQRGRGQRPRAIAARLDFQEMIHA